MSAAAPALVQKPKKEYGIGFGRVLTVLMTMPPELLEKVIERSESETLHSAEQQELRARRLRALKASL